MKPSPRQLNKRCPCGSGKAFKNCHGEEFLVKRRPRVPNYTAESDHYVDAPGYTYLTSTFLYENEDQPRTDPLGEPGKYEATVTLLQPGQSAEKLSSPGMNRVFEVQNEKIAGDSHLAMCLPKDARPSPNADIGMAAMFRVQRPDSSADDVEITLKPNEHGRLSKVIVKLTAQDFSDAERRAHFEASSLLSYLAFELDIPLRVAHTSIKETSSWHVRVGFVRQFSYKGLGNLPDGFTGGGWSSMEMKGDVYAALTSIYREALNSDSPFYQFLCFCRVIQRLKERLRPRWERTVLEHDKGLLPTYRKRERFPADGEEADRFPDHVWGKKFYAVYDEHLRPLRNGIGHIFLQDMDDEDSAERPTDEYEFVSEVYVLLPVAHHVARTMLHNDFGQGGLARIAVGLGRPEGGR